MEKKGQFYLLVVIIVIVVLIGLATVGNFAYSKGSRESVKLYELSKDLQLEGESVINYGIFNNADLNAQLNGFTKDYGEYISKGDSDVYFIYGDKNEVNVRGYVTSTVGNIGLNIGGSYIDQKISGSYTTRDNIPVPKDTQGNVEPNVLITVGGTNY